MRQAEKDELEPLAEPVDVVAVDELPLAAELPLLAELPHAVRAKVASARPPPAAAAADRRRRRGRGPVGVGVLDLSITGTHFRKDEKPKAISLSA
jgi:hypothetical protein